MSIQVSKNNSTSTPLGAGAAFTGEHDILTTFSETTIVLAGEPSNAPGTLYFEYSPDSVHWDISEAFVLDGPKIIPFPLRTILPYFRVRYVNGVTPQTEFRLTTVFHRIGAMRLTRFRNQALDVNEPVEVVRILSPPALSSITTSVGQSATSVTLVAPNANRRGVTLYNEASVSLYVKLGATASTSSYSFQLKPDGFASLGNIWAGVIDGIWPSAGAGSARISEQS